jgi:gas vesicle protein
MFSRVKIAIRFFFVGLVVGVLLAPRSGRATRHLLRTRADRLFNDLLDAATLGAYDADTAAEGLNAEDSNGSSDEPAPSRRRTAASAQS